MGKFTSGNRLKLTTILCFIVMAGIITFTDACKKCNRPEHCTHPHGQPTTTTSTSVSENTPVVSTTDIKVVTIANIRKATDGSSTQVMFCQLAELFTVSDASVLAILQDAFDNHRQVRVTVNPYSANVMHATALSGVEMAARQVNAQIINEGLAMNLNNLNEDIVDQPAALGVINTTTPGLTNVIPDMATAQLMFDYITHQCCAIPGPYGVDFCISFQYCEDGCYARAHKMCWIINNMYHYDTHKIFSFANSGGASLSVKAEKWGGCCINWWYHVAPLVNIKTPTGTKAYVFDPAMFDQPVLLSAWLHAQANPACSGSAHVSMINIQPTASYSPASYAGTTFDTDPMYADTDSTMVNYRPRVSCP